ncbi:MAG: hypothetical protein ACFBSC_01875 [Microcoleaceae cyanobacterium]
MQQQQTMTASRVKQLNPLLTAIGTCISIYMPTIEAGPETRQNPIRFKNLLNQTQDKLVQQGWKESDIAELLKPVEELDRDDFWQNQKQGLAIFIAPDLFKFYQLPQQFEEQVVISRCFQIKPLIPLLLSDEQFFLLALSQNQVQFFRGSRYTIEKVELPGSTPSSLAEALKYDDPEEQLQAHTANPNPAAGQSMMYHGQGVGTTDNKDQIQRFLQKVDTGLSDYLMDGTSPQRPLPIVLAGVEYVLSIYRAVSHNPDLLKSEISGNPENMTVEELHRQAWPIVESHFRRRQEQATTQYRELVGIEANQASEDFSEIVGAAHNGRIDSLFMVADERKFGQFDPKTNEATLSESPQSQDEDLMNFAAVHTLLNSGMVYICQPSEMPNHGEVAAILRY